MLVPAGIIASTIQFAARAGRAALKSGVITSKFSTAKIGGYLIEAERRWTVGKDGAISTIVRISKNGITQEVWHVVSKGLRILDKHRK